MPRHVKRLVKAGTGYVEASELVDSTQPYRGAPDKARQRFLDHGYLLVRDLIPRDDVSKVCCTLISFWDLKAFMPESGLSALLPQLDELLPTES